MIIKHKFILIAFIAIAVAVILTGRGKTYNRDIYGVFDTVSNISIHSTKDTTADYEQLLKKLDSQLNVYNENSIISKLNNGELCALPPELTVFLSDAASYSSYLGDYFDISLNPVISSWTLAEKNLLLPDDIKEKLSLVGIDALYIDYEANTAKIKEDGASINLGAVAKGYAANVLADRMRADAIGSALINLGGNVYAVGAKPDGSDWNIAICDPENTAQTAVTVKCTDSAVVTSGDYERYFELDGKKYHHIIDPKTGYPSDSGLSSVTIIDRDAMLCDVLSTAIFVAGANKAQEILSKFGGEAILIENNNIYYTDGLVEKIELNSDKYFLIPLQNR
ncbi:MAG: FAD:protein FMN transferase [Eubacteriales bacterium]|nr:FAD:protein FMN transferase [Eubacteriales bacterium]